MRELGPRAMGAYAALRSQIIAGEWPPGTRLPSQTALARLLAVAPLTLRQALNRLEAEGMISRQSRRGTFVQRASAVSVPGLREMFRIMFQHAPLGVLVVDAAGRVLESNPAFQDLLGYTGAELEGTLIRDYTHPEDLDRQTQAVSLAITEHRRFFDLEKRYIRKDGEVIRCRLIVYSITLDGADVGGVSMIERLP